MFEEGRTTRLDELLHCCLMDDIWIVVIADVDGSALWTVVA